MKRIYCNTAASKRVFKNLLLGVSFFALAQEAAAQTYCTPTYTYNCSSGDDIKDMILNGAAGTMINNLNNPCPSTGYQDYTTSTAPNMSAILIMGNSYNGNVTTSYAYASESVKVWIDFNHNGTFESTEVVATLNAISNTSTGAITVAVPLTATAGVTRMRVRLVYTSSATSIDPCNNASYGECHDYKVTLQPPAPPNNAGVGSLISPDATPFCSNSMKEVSVSVINLGSNALNSANINWSVDGVVQPAVTLPSTLANYKDSVTVVLGNVLFPSTTPLQIVAWTDMPNATTDADHSDDTLKASAAAVLQGVDVHLSPRDTTICQGGSVTFDAGSFPYDPIYIWSTGSLDSFITVGAAGSYSVKVQNTLGCFDRDTVAVSLHPNPLVNSIAIVDNGDNSFTFNVIGAQNISAYEWDFGDGSTPVTGTGLPTQVIHPYTTPGEYTVTLTLSNDCGEIKSESVVLVGTPTGIGSHSALQKEIRLYPNPGKDYVTVNASNNVVISQIDIYTLTGQRVLNLPAGNKQTIDVSSWANGIYHMVISTDKGRLARKLEVIR
ncbi:GEVED domain-containing protein [Taibaiella helva]|uniref:GEVED domain-containing protein n=1 Tax=Taibaiella helva TaxID=2301235 RepID=UPI000E5701C0|nr:GEVED domain-containing protein [Taibaiella helva]